MKKHLTKILALLLALTVVFSLAACGGKNDDETTTAADGTTQEATEAGVSVEDSTGTTKALPSGSEQDKIIRDALGKDVQWDGDFKTLTDEQKQKVKDAFKDEGYIVNVTDDGVSVEDSTGTTIPGETTTEGSGESTTPDSSQPGVSTTAAQVSNKKPETKAEILAAYTAVMDKAKNDKPAYKKKEFQAVPKDKRNITEGKTLITVMLELAGLFMKEENKAEVEDTSMNSDMRWFPVYKAKKGCLLTNTGAIESAKCDPLPNGNYKITIVLNDEMDPEPYNDGQAKATSNHGNMFSPLARSEIDNTLKTDWKVKLAVKNANFDLKYYNCTAELTYNPKTNRIVTLNQYMHVLINIKSPTKVTGKDVIGTAVLDNTLKIWDVKY